MIAWVNKQADEYYNTPDAQKDAYIDKVLNTMEMLAGKKALERAKDDLAKGPSKMGSSDSERRNLKK